MLLVLLTGT